MKRDYADEGFFLLHYYSHRETQNNAHMFKMATVGYSSCNAIPLLCVFSLKSRSLFGGVI